MPTIKELKRLTLVFVIWRIILFGVGDLAPKVLPYKPTFPYYDQVLPFYSVPPWIYSWANFDGVHYLTIAENGYVGTAAVQAFFPMYPYVILHGIKLYAPWSFNAIKTGLVVSNLAAYLLVITFFAYLKKIKNAKIAWLSVLLMLCFPTSFFFGALYSESLFLLFVVSAFFAAEKKWWFIAGLFAALASATRIVGMFLIPALIIELFHQEFVVNQLRGCRHNFQLAARCKQFGSEVQVFLAQHCLELTWLLLSSLGALSYMYFLKIFFHDAFYFVHVQAVFNTGRSTTSLVSYPQVVYRAAKILLFARPFDLRYWEYAQEFFAGTVGLIGLGLAAKFVRPSVIVFSVAAFLLPTLTGTFSSMPRYILVCFPIYIGLAQLLYKRPKLGIVWVAVSCLLLILNTILFIQGYWVA